MISSAMSASCFVIISGGVNLIVFLHKNLALIMPSVTIFRFYYSYFVLQKQALFIAESIFEYKNILSYKPFFIQKKSVFQLFS